MLTITLGELTSLQVGMLVNCVVNH